MRPYSRYLLFQVPGWLTIAAVMGFLHATAGVSGRVGVVVVALTVALDFVLYPFFRHSYASRPRAGPETLIGARGRVAVTLDPHGFIRIRGERWNALLSDFDKPANEGDTVEVTGIRGLTLIVRRVEKPNAASEPLA